MDCTDKALNTKCVHGGHINDQYGAVVTPIYQVSTFRCKDVDHGARLFNAEEEGFIYTRMGNPTVNALEDCLTMLEYGKHSLACATGMAAIHLVFAHVLKAGDHIVCAKSVYGPTVSILTNLFPKFGVEVTFADATDNQAMADAMQDKTKLVYVETPCNPTLAITDLKAVAEIAHKHNAQLCVDNTFMSPVFQNPLKKGADIVIHSMTKFINGHADVVAGCVIINNDEDYPAWRKTMNLIGGTIDPFNAFLVHRGIKTMKLRVEAAACGAMKIAEHLEAHPKIDKIWYPGLKSFPQYELHNSQASGPGAIISIELKGGLEAGRILLNNIKVLQLGVSLGGVESLIQHPASMTHSSMSKEQRESAGITDGLVRIAIGIECCEEIIEALDEALEKC